jgi:hypothetical protein
VAFKIIEATMAYAWDLSTPAPWPDPSVPLPKLVPLGQQASRVVILPLQVISARRALELHAH